jgi:hypothetical protein
LKGAPILSKKHDPEASHTCRCPHGDSDGIPVWGLQFLSKNMTRKRVMFAGAPKETCSELHPSLSIGENTDHQHYF